MRRSRAKKREVLPDVVYGRVDFARFINYLMKDGKKSVAERVFYKSLEIIKSKEKGADPVEVVEKAFANVAPDVEVRTRRVGGANYQVPQPVRPERRYALTYRWIIKAATDKTGKSMAERLAEEFLAAIKGEGAAIKKKQDVERVAIANRAFAHFAKSR